MGFRCVLFPKSLNAAMATAASDRFRRPLSRGSNPCSYPHKPLVSYRINRQLAVQAWFVVEKILENREVAASGIGHNPTAQATFAEAARCSRQDRSLPARKQNAIATHGW
jgi:hypothetical protein